jgi:hypothetical protein
MRRAAAAAFAVTAAVMSVTPLAGVAHADVLGNQAFQFEMTCTGLGDVLTTNAGPSQSGVLQVVGTNTILQFTSSDHPPVGRITKATAAGTTCTLIAAGPPGDLQPKDPEVFPVVIVNG